jgi:hypothetical protein
VRAGELEEAGSFEGPAAVAGPAVYARSYDALELPGEHVAAGAPASPGDWDEVDELFRGGR